MNSYFERNQAQITSQLSPHANFLSQKMQTKVKVWVNLVVRPKQMAVTQIDFRPATDIPTQGTQMVHDAQQCGRESYLNLGGNHNTQNDIVNIMQRQNDIKTLLVQRNVSSALPIRNIHVFY